MRFVGLVDKKASKSSVKKSAKGDKAKKTESGEPYAEKPDRL